MILMSEVNVHNETLKRMISHLVEKEEILRDLLRFTIQQKEMLNGEENDLEVDAFNEVLAERSKLMDRADHLDEAFLKEFSALKTSLGVDSLDNLSSGVLDSSLVKDLQHHVKKVQELAVGLNQVDTENRHAMKEQMESLKTEINRVKQGKKAIHGYANTKRPQPSIFMDEKEKSFKKK